MCISVGIFSGLAVVASRQLIHSFSRTGLGLSGHKAFLWMTPLLIARFRTGAKIGATAGSMFAAMTAYSLGSNFAGGLIGFPMIGVAAAILDGAADFIEKRKLSGFSIIFILAFAGVAANLVCFNKRLLNPSGHANGSLIADLFLYMLFGMISGVVAAVTVKTISRLKGECKE